MTAQEKGAVNISAEGLQQLLSKLETGIPEKEFGILFAAKQEISREKYRVRADINLAFFRSIIASGQAALKSMFLINGGAAVAVLALIGHLSTSANSSPTVSRFALPLLCFAFGLLLTTTASGLTYLAQKAYSERSKGRRRGNRIGICIVLLSIAALAAFVIGCGFAYDSIRHVAESSYSFGGDRR